MQSGTTHQDPPEEGGAARMSRLATWIDRQPRWVLTIYAMAAAFAAYASMYAFRKPFTAAEYQGLTAFSVVGVVFSYKSIAVISQLLGYMCSKFIGIKVASEATFSRRVPLVLGLIGCAEIMLVLFGLVPQPWNIVFLFFNGLPLGMVWSLLFGLLEGRRVTEFLGLGMSISVIFSSGWVKAVGRLTIEQANVSEFWMPAVTGLLFTPLLLLSLAMLQHLPPPDALDRAQRTERAPMSRAQRHAFVLKHAPGLVLLVLGYMMLMAYRDLRDSFMPDILREMGHAVDSGSFARIESFVGLLVIPAMFLLWFFKDNRHGVWANMTLVTIGSLLLGSATLLFQSGRLSPGMFYMVNGAGLYIAFVPYQSTLMDRLLASLHTVATASFLIAIADSFGYLSTVSLYLTRDIYGNFVGRSIPWATLLIVASYVVMVGVPLAILGSGLYFRKHLRA